MIKAFVYTITLFIFFSSATQASEKITFKYNIDKSLPQDWVKEFKNIMDILQDVLPIDKNFNKYIKISNGNLYME